ncbi:Tuberous sclerosis 2-like protein [Entophlyctis sp. JEL0112]|nr:Tuberous sclerosis 2-like protein [Entophlyctis sp. JEL0112]
MNSSGIDEVATALRAAALAHSAHAASDDISSSGATAAAITAVTALFPDEDYAYVDTPTELLPALDRLLDALATFIASASLFNRQAEASSALRASAAVLEATANAQVLLPIFAASITLSRLLGAVCLYLSFSNVLFESGIQVVQSLLTSSSKRISQQTHSEICNLIANGLQDTFDRDVFPSRLSTSLARIGAIRALAYLCFSKGPVVDTFATSHSFRKTVLHSCVTASICAPSSFPDYPDFAKSMLESMDILVRGNHLTPDDHELLADVARNLIQRCLPFANHEELLFKVCNALFNALPASDFRRELAFILYAPRITQDVKIPVIILTDLLAFLRLKVIEEQTFILSDNSVLHFLRDVFFAKNLDDMKMVRKSIIDCTVDIILTCGDANSPVSPGFAAMIVDILRLCISRSDSPEYIEAISIILRSLDSIALALKKREFNNLLHTIHGGCICQSLEVSEMCTKSLLRLMKLCITERFSVGVDVLVEILVEIFSNSASILDIRLRCLQCVLSMRLYSVTYSDCFYVKFLLDHDLLTWADIDPKVELTSSKLKVIEPSKNYRDTGSTWINLDAYIGAVLKVLETVTQWELFRVAIYGLPKQLQNFAIFPSALSTNSVESLRIFFCDTVVAETVAASVINFPTTAKKSELYAEVFGCLSSVILWHKDFSKIQVDEVLKCFQLGLHRWPLTARFCLNELTFLLTEIPLSMVRAVPEVMTKISRLTSLQMAPHVLEFLSTLGRMPEIYVNLNEANYKRVFGIALQHIQTGAATSIPSSQNALSTSPLVAQYSSQLAYHVINVWFVNLNIEDRRKYVPFILASVLAHEAAAGNVSPSISGGNVVSESVEIVVDMLVQNTFANCARHPGLAVLSTDSAFNDFSANSKWWLVGNSIISIHRQNMTGWATVAIRRPSGVVVFSSKLENRLFDGTLTGSNISIPSLVERAVQDGDTLGAVAEASENKEFAQQSKSSLSPEIPPTVAVAALDPSFFLVQFAVYPAQSKPTQHIPLPCSEDSVNRAIKVLDRTPFSDLHKIGVLYVGRNQTTEKEILQNTSGSPAYTRFINGLGRMFRLNGLRGVHTGGLDTSPAEIDGKACIVWEDSVLGNQIVFHTATLMPSDVEKDPLGSLKKRHIGNDFVSIFFDDSGKGAISFDTLPGQFNFVNIIITPLNSASENCMERYHVVMKAKPDLGLPPIGVFADGFLVDGSVLAGVVRRAALHANMLALVAVQNRAGGLGFTSNVRERLRQIKRLAERMRNGADLAKDDSGMRLELFDFTRYI